MHLSKRRAFAAAVLLLQLAVWQCAAIPILPVTLPSQHDNDDATIDASPAVAAGDVSRRSQAGDEEGLPRFESARASKIEDGSESSSNSTDTKQEDPAASGSSDDSSSSADNKESGADDGTQDPSSNSTKVEDGSGSGGNATSNSNSTQPEDGGSQSNNSTVTNTNSTQSSSDEDSSSAEYGGAASNDGEGGDDESDQGTTTPVDNRDALSLADECIRWVRHPPSDGEVFKAHSQFAFVRGETVYLWGGNFPAVLRSLNTKSYNWDELEVTVAEGSDLTMVELKREGQAYTYNPSSSRVHVFGGIRTTNGDITPVGTLERLELDTSTGTWTVTRPQITVTDSSAVPPALTDASLSSRGSLLVLFGGRGDNGYSNKVHLLSTSGTNRYSWRSPAVTGDVPAPRSGHTMTRIGTQYYLFGGASGSKSFNDLHVLSEPASPDVGVWTWKLLNPAQSVRNGPTPRAFHSAVALPESRLAVIGGIDSNSDAGLIYRSDVRIYDVSSDSWAALPSSIGPKGDGSRRAAATMSPDGDSVLVMGGELHHHRLNVFEVHELDLKSVCQDSCKSGTYVDKPTPHCVCDSAHTGKFCEEKRTCPRCGDHGRCVGGECVCDEGFAGRHCEQVVCPSVNGTKCSGFGLCSLVEKRCVCKVGRWGLACEHTNCPLNCGGFGLCHASASGDVSTPSSTFCDCQSGFTGPSCTEVVEPKSNGDNGGDSDDTSTQFIELSMTATATSGGAIKPPYACLNNCTGHGTCHGEEYNGAVRAVCKCEPGFGGIDCSGECTLHCSGHGTCEGTDPLAVECKCQPGFKGVGCLESECVDDCNADKKWGSCVNNTCMCAPGRDGASCNIDTNCTGHGQFTANPPSCACDSGFAGVSCSEPVKCSPSCVHGKCQGVADADGVLVGRCVCPPEWGGEVCAERQCPNKCLGKGSCVEGTCRCYSGFAGEDCGQVLPCPGNCTGDHGVCVPIDATSATGKCECNPGWSGHDCSQLACVDNCHGHGQCKEGKCLCDAGHTGTNCEVECPNQCSGNGVCMEGACGCHPGFSGDDCSHEATCPVVNNQTCAGRGECYAPLSQCFCQPGATGDDCSQESTCGDGCSGHGDCKYGRCHCDPGYTGEHCEAAVSCPNDCSGRGVCTNGRCFCTPSYKGEDCSVFVNDTTCANCPPNRGLCQEGQCACVQGWGGANCSTPVDQDRCYRAADDPLMCSGNGRCEYASCHCNPGWVGKFCDQREQCQHGCVDGQGQCMGGKCYCLPGFTGPDCSEDLPCPGGALPCTGRGVCVQGKCMCMPGYQGEACEAYTESAKAQANGTCKDNCNNQGTCVLGQCFCVEGYSGLACENKVPDSCPDNCNDHGVCRFGRCFCRPGFIGKACEQELKCSSRCLENGVCAYGKCFCVPGWTGTDCNLATDFTQTKARLEADVRFAVEAARRVNNDSSSCVDSCNMHGVCVDNKCACEQGYTGATCADVVSAPLVNRCANNCTGNGRCLFGRCYCDLGWAGDECATRAAIKCPYDCNGDNGICHFGKCYCRRGFTGVSCEKAVAVSESSETSTSTSTTSSAENESTTSAESSSTSTEGGGAEQQQQQQQQEEQQQEQSTPAQTEGEKLQFREVAATATTDSDSAVVTPASGLSECDYDCGEKGVCFKDHCYCTDSYTGERCDVPPLESAEVLAAQQQKSIVSQTDSPAAAALADAGKRTSVWLVAAISFVFGVLACMVGQMVYENRKRSQNKQETRKLLRPLLNSIDAHA